MGEHLIKGINMILKYKITAIATICFALTGCGGGGDEESPASMTDQITDTDTNTDNTGNGNDVAASVLTGVFVDSAVEGVTYTTATQSGVTNSAGEYNYLAGEQVTFSIGATQLPVVTAAPQVSPVEMAASTSNPAATTTNIARLLQSLDGDGNPDNGITISPTAAANAAFINFNVSTDQFANDPNVINLVANSGSTTTSLISADAANAHLNETLGISTETNVPSSNNFSQSVLVDGSPWFAIRNFGSAERLDTCGNTYSFFADGSFTVLSRPDDRATNFQTFNGTYTLTDSGTLTLMGNNIGDGQVVFELNDLSGASWSTNRPDSNDAGDFVEIAFSDRASAISFANGIGTNCENFLSM